MIRTNDNPKKKCYIIEIIKHAQVNAGQRYSVISLIIINMTYLPNAFYEFLMDNIGELSSYTVVVCIDIHNIL